MKRIFFLLLGLMIALAGCSTDARHKVVGDQLTVYFDQVEAESAAKKIALFWKENSFVTGKKQDLKLTLEGKNLTLFMIANNPKEVKDISFEEQKMLRELEMRIQKELFPEYTVRLVIANDQFAPILTLD